MEFAQEINQDLEAFLNRELKQGTSLPPRLIEAVYYSALSPGKRLRPRILLEMGRILGLKKENLLPAALALELFHAFTLVHDDLPAMDDDDERRGIPTTHKKFGEAIAILAGNSLSLLSVQSLIQTSSLIPEKRTLKALSRFLSETGSLGVMGGQALEFIPHAVHDLKTLENLQDLKTGALFSLAFLLPFDLAGETEECAKYQATLRFAREFGRLFQGLDDLGDREFGEPYSILHYFTPEEAQEKILTSFQKAEADFKEAFQDASLPLLKILRTTLELPPLS